MSGDAAETSRARPPGPTGVDDHELAGRLAHEVGVALLALRTESLAEGRSMWELEMMGDQIAHELLVERIKDVRPDDIVLSEEGADDRRRLDADRVWIVDPLDGTVDYGSRSGDNFAVHVALVVDCQPVAAAVSVPARSMLYGTRMSPLPGPPVRERPLVIAGRSQARTGAVVARALGGEVVVAGSAGLKATAVVGGEADVYVHGSGLWEWDACAPAAVARAAGLHVSGADGSYLVFNQPRPVVPGLVVSRPEYARAVLAALGA